VLNLRYKSSKITKHPSGKRPTFTNNIVHNGNGSVKLSNYLKAGKTNDTSPKDDHSIDSHNSSNCPPLPHQYLTDNSTYFSDSSNSSSETNATHAKSVDTTPVKELLYRKSPGLQKPFRTPLTKAATVITPQTKAITSPTTATNGKTIETDITPSIAKASDHQPKAVDDTSPNNEGGNDTYIVDEGTNITNSKTNNTTVNSIKNSKTNPKSKKPTVYHSPYLHKTFKPNHESLELPPELKSLTPLLMLQHEALTSHIK